MSFDKAEWLAGVGERMKKRTADALPALRQAQAQAPPMQDVLTQFDYWNRYVSYLQELSERTAKRRDAAQARMNAPDVWDAAVLAKLKSDILTADAMISAWDVAMKLPKALIEDAEKARELVEQYGREDEPAIEPQS